MRLPPINSVYLVGGLLRGGSKDRDMEEGILLTVINNLYSIV